MTNERQAPRTKAGRTFTRRWGHRVWCMSKIGEPCDCGLNEEILAIEAEAEALDVERLARAMLTRDFSTLHRCLDCYRAEAAVIAREYRDGGAA